jgi:hypothetical protein
MGGLELGAARDTDNAWGDSWAAKYRYEKITY